MPRIKIVSTPSKLRKFDPGGLTTDETSSPFSFGHLGLTDTTTTQFSFGHIDLIDKSKPVFETPKFDMKVPGLSFNPGADKGFIRNPETGKYEQPKKPVFKSILTTSTTTTKVEPGDCPKGYYKNSKGECVRKRRGVELANDIIQGTLTFGNVFARVSENKDAKAQAEQTMRRKAYSSGVMPVDKATAFGHVEGSGVEWPNMMTPPNEGMFTNYIGRQASVGKLGGSFMGFQNNPGTVKIKIIGEPDTEVMKYGGQSGYGFDSGWKRLYTDMNKVSSDHYTNSMSEDKNSDEKPVLEAEGGETLYKPGDSTLHNLNGPKHTKGGIKLTASQVNSESKDVPSFIFSDTAKLKIKDPAILDHFGVAYKKGGVTPAKISKKFDLNKYKAILQDPNSDELDTSTAQLMVDKNEIKLAELAAIQEQMKGKNPPRFVEQTLRKGSAKFGGFIPKYDGGGSGPGDELGDFSEDYSTLEKLLKDDSNKALREEIFNRYKKANPNTKITEDDYINNLLEAQKQFYAINNKYKGDNKFLKDPEWDRTAGGRKNKRYKETATSLGFKPLTESQISQFQQAYRDLEDAMHDPDFFKSFGQYFMTDPIGKPDQSYRSKPISPVDDIAGNTTIGQLFRLRQTEKPPTIITSTTTTAAPVGPRYFCRPDGKGGGTVEKLPEGSIGGYSSVEEASKNCGKPPIKTPFDYLLPDKVNMLAHAAIFPRQIFSYNPELPYNKKPLGLEDWRAKAAQRFSTQYAAPSSELDVYGPTQGLAANKAFLAGQTAQQMAAEDIAPTISRNVDRVNQYNAAEAQREDTITAYNNMQKQKRWEGYATTLQNYDNAMRQYLKENSDAFTRAWKNRMQLGDINDTNPNFFKDPTSGRQTWKGNAFYTGTGSDSDSGDLGKMYSLYYQKFLEDMKSDIPDEEERKKAARALAMKQIDASRYSETTDPYSNRTRRRSAGFDFET